MVLILLPTCYYNPNEICAGCTDEIITFSAHYDSVSYSKGAYDNASGSACILELLAYFNQHKPDRTLRFIWCGSEEEGLLGSRDYVEKHKKDLYSCFCYRFIIGLRK